MSKWKNPKYDLPSAYEEVEVLIDGCIICRDMIIRNEFDENELGWKHFLDAEIEAWREITL